MKYLTICSCIVLAFAFEGSAQTSSPPPMTLQAQTPSEMPKNVMLPIACNNVSGKPIAAYVFYIDSFDANGKQVFREIHTGMPGLNPKHPESTKAAGSNWTENVKLAKQGAPVARREITLDYVLFAENAGNWGPDSLKYSLKIDGFKAGLAMSSAKTQ